MGTYSLLLFQGLECQPENVQVGVVSVVPKNRHAPLFKSDERFSELSADYEAEQRELKERAAALREEP